MLEGFLTLTHYNSILEKQRKKEIRKEITAITENTKNTKIRIQRKEKIDKQT